MAKFVIRYGVDGLYYFNLKADNGEIMLRSEGYSTKASCLQGVTITKQIAGNDEAYQRKASGAQFLFTLKSKNGQIIGISEKYTSPGHRDRAIELVKRIAGSAEVWD